MEEGKDLSGAPIDIEAINTPDPAVQNAQKETVFEAYEKSLLDADFDWRRKTGHDREVGQKSIDNLNEAFIAAGLIDRHKAIDMYRRQTNKDPAESMLRSLDHAEKNGKRPDIADLTAGIAALSQRKKEISAIQELDILKKNQGDYQIAHGDETARAIDYKKRARKEIMTPEQNRDDSGLFLLRAVFSGFRAADDYKRAAQSRRKAGHYKSQIKAANLQISEISKQSRHFEKTQKGPVLAATAGPRGMAMATFSGLAAMTKDLITTATSTHLDESVHSRPGLTGDSAKAAHMHAQMQRGQGIGL